MPTVFSLKRLLRSLFLKKEENNVENRIKLGQKVQDDISLLQGTVVAITHWLYGCERITIQPFGNKDGKPYDTFTVDEPQVVVLNEPVAPPASPRHGGRDDVARRSDVS